jgi:hypothetical protein
MDCTTIVWKGKGRPYFPTGVLCRSGLYASDLASLIDEKKSLVQIHIGKLPYIADINMPSDDTAVCGYRATVL